jgi:TonB family protein
MRINRLAGAAMIFAASVGARLEAQGQGVWLEWNNAGLTLYPDSSGVFMYFRIHAEPGARQPNFTASFDPARLDEWLREARTFNTRVIEPSDTSQLLNTAMLQSIIGDGLRVVRRRDHGEWSKERFIVMETIRDTQPVVFIGGELSVGQILDSLAAVSKRTRFSQSAAQQVISETLLGAYDKEASASPKNFPPAYPMGALRARRSGFVVMSFYVDSTGRAEMNTARPFFSTEDSFTASVMAALPSMIFFPAEKDGRKVRSRVVMPFSFTVVR